MSESDTQPTADSPRTNAVTAAMQRLLPRADLIVFLRLILALFTVMGIWSSRKAWLCSERNFPLVPLIPNLPQFTAPFDQLIPISLTVLVVAVIFSKRTVLCVALLAVAFALAIVADQSRFQPWCYQYVFMLFALSIPPRDDLERENASIAACRIVLASIYIYSGLHKLNTVFASEIFGWMASGLSSTKVTSYAVPQTVAYSFAGLESTIGLCLLIPQTRLLGVILGILMHVMVLTCLGPGGLNWNGVIWPWNIAMTFMLVILFVLIDAPFRSLKANPLLTFVTVGLFTVAPAFSFFGKWDYYPSFALYSGDSYNGDIAISSEVYESLPRKMKKDCSLQPGEPVYLNIGNWATDDMDMPCYPERRVLLEVTRKFQHKFNAGKVILRLRRGTYAWEHDRHEEFVQFESP